MVERRSRGRARVALGAHEAANGNRHDRTRARRNRPPPLFLDYLYSTRHYHAANADFVILTNYPYFYIFRKKK